LKDYVVPPRTDDPEEMRKFYEQVCLYINTNIADIETAETDITDLEAAGLTYVKTDGSRSIDYSSGEFKIGDVAGGNYVGFESDGTAEFNGDATVWDDLRTPISVASKISGKEPAEVAYKGGIVYEFNTGNDETCAFNVQLPHAYKLGTDIEFHIHYLIRADGANGVDPENVKWDFTYSWADIDDEQPAETTVSTTIDVKALTADTHYLGEIASTIDGSGISGVSSMIICSLGRDVSVANNYTDDVLVMELDFHYQIDTLGSRDEAVK
jgi:hypothetical protein